VALVGAICVYFLVRSFAFPQPRIIRNDVIQGIIIGWGLVFVTAQIYARTKARRVNGWITMYGLGEPGNGMLLRAAHAQLFSCLVSHDISFEKNWEFFARH
jgi:hypothetical protein